MKLLMHTCCAPCSVYCIDALRSEGIEPVLYWYNPNIHPYKEYEQRLNCLKEYSKKINIEAIFEDEYGLNEFCKNVSNDINLRCVTYCYIVRLKKTFEYAKMNGYTHVTTTLLYSIYQKHDYIKKLMENLSKEYGVEFLYRDFRHGFWVGHEKAKEEGLYMQKYCGCIFSMEDSVLKKEKNKPKLPEEFKFLPVKRSIVIKKEKENKEKYINLLLETCQSKEMINKYLSYGDLYVLKYKEDIACVAVLTRNDENNATIELKYLITCKKYRCQGFAKKMIKYLSDNYKQKYNQMIVRHYRK